MKNFNLIRKNEGLLWEKAFDSHRISDYCVATMMKNSEPNNNFNQVFYWGDESERAAALTSAKEFYSENNTYGFSRSESSKELEENIDSETYVVIDPSTRLDPKKHLTVEIFPNLSSDPNFEVVFKDAFGLNDTMFEGFKSRMDRISSEVESKYFVGYFEGKAVTACGLYKSEDYLFLMNFSTLKECQGQGYGQSTLARVLEESAGMPIALRTSDSSLAKVFEKKNIGQLIWSTTEKL